MIEICVWGMDPAPQGSKSVSRSGFAYEANKNTRPWRQAVASAAAEVMAGVIGKDPSMSQIISPREILTGPCRLEVFFVFTRPGSHFGTGKNAGVLKASAPTHHPKKPDTDKLLRAIGDALTGVVVRDDSQFSEVIARKTYTEYGDSPGVRILVTPL